MFNYRIISTHVLTRCDNRGNPIGDARKVQTSVQVVAQHPKDPDIREALERSVPEAMAMLAPLTPEMRVGAMDRGEEAEAAGRGENIVATPPHV